MSKKSAVRVAMIASNYYHMTGIKLLKPQNQRLYFLYFNDFDDPGFDMLPIIIELDNYEYQNLRELKWVMAKVGFPEMGIPWLMVRWPYFNPKLNQKLKVKWHDDTFRVRKGKCLKFRYAFV